MKKLLLVLLFSASTYGTSAATRPDIKTLAFPAGQGEIPFRFESNWHILAGTPKPPISSILFELPDPADVGTPESTNLEILRFDLSSPKARAAQEKLLSIFNKNEKIVQRSPRGTTVREAYGIEMKMNNWRIHRRKAIQRIKKNGLKPVRYQINEAYTVIHGNGLYVLLSWPVLPKNSPSYDTTMNQDFGALLHSIRYRRKPK